MTNTESNYVYTLDDLYKIFQQEEWFDVKVQLLTEWKAMNLPYRINWDNLISKYVNQGLAIFREIGYIGIIEKGNEL